MSSLSQWATETSPKPEGRPPDEDGWSTNSHCRFRTGNLTADSSAVCLHLALAAGILVMREAGMIANYLLRELQTVLFNVDISQCISISKNVAYLLAYTNASNSLNSSSCSILESIINAYPILRLLTSYPLVTLFDSISLVPTVSYDDHTFTSYSREVQNKDLVLHCTSCRRAVERRTSY